MWQNVRITINLIRNEVGQIKKQFTKDLKKNRKYLEKYPEHILSSEIFPEKLMGARGLLQKNKCLLETF